MSTITLNQYLKRRLGNSEDAGVLLKIMFIRAFSAGSFKQFWHYWNPVYGYYLYYYCYQPLRRRLRLPSSICTMLTFAASGFFLHDLPFGWWVRVFKTKSLPVPFVTLWFLLMAILVLVTDSQKLNYREQAVWVRVLINSAFIIIPGLIALSLS